MQVVESLEAAQAASQPSAVRDHISWCHHLNDHLRICLVPKRKGASFRDWPGVITWPNREQPLPLQRSVTLPDWQHGPLQVATLVPSGWF